MWGFVGVTVWCSMSALLCHIYRYRGEEGASSSSPLGQSQGGNMDREVAYEQNVSGLEIAWADRIASFARSAVHTFRTEYNHDREGLQFAASEAVTERLLDSERWANVKATDISDIAYEAVGRVIDAR